MDIEEVAEKTPERLLTLPIDIYQGITDDMALKVADFLKFEGDLKEKVSFIYTRTYNSRCQKRAIVYCLIILKLFVVFIGYLCNFSVL